MNAADLRSFPQEQIDNWFTYHAPTPEQLIQYQEIRTAAKIFAETINRHVPAGADKSAAIRLVREATMTANAGIACDAPVRASIVEVEANSPRPPHQQRVFAEKSELDEKLIKLAIFIQDNPLFASLPEAEQERLSRQLQHMSAYSYVLQERIEAFTAPATDATA